MRRLLSKLLIFAQVAMGATYEIAEPDLLEEIKNREGIFLKKVREFSASIREPAGRSLIPARKNRVRYINPEYCLEENIFAYEKNSRYILYPEGFCFNPLDYIPYTPPKIIVFNPCRENEVKRVKQIADEESILVSAGCPIHKIRNLDRPVYLLTEELVKKLSLKHTISVISVEGSKIRVEEIKVDDSGGE